MMQTPVLKVAGLGAGYAKLPIVSDVSFEVSRGEMLALVGRNGVGKTTTLQAVAGSRYGMNCGSVTVDGVDVSAAPAHEIASAGMALVPEGRRIFLQLTVRENLELGAFVHGKMKTKELEQQLARVYDLFPALVPKARQDAAALSGGQQQMVAVGQALMAQPKVLLLDEPTAGIAPILCDELYAVLHALCAAQMAIVIVDQSLDRALSNATRFIVMDNGRMVAAGDCKDVGVHEEISNILLGSSAAPGGAGGIPLSNRSEGSTNAVTNSMSRSGR
jgi:branched-chain amino acid transport system ATP-binding protein